MAKGSLGRASALTALGTGAGRAIGLLSALGGAAALGSQEYGAFIYLATTATVVSSLGVLGFVPLVTRAVASKDTPAPAAELSTAVLALVGLLSAFWGICLIAIVSSVDLTHAGPEYRVLQGSGITAVGLWALGIGLSSIVGAVVSGRRRFLPLTVLNVVKATAVGGAALTVSATTGTATLSALAAGAAELLLAAGGVAYLHRERYIKSFSWRHMMAPLAALTKGAASAGFASISILGAMWLMQSLLLLRADGLSENGGLGLATRLSLLVSFLPSALATASIPYVGRQSDPARARALAKRIIKVGLGASLGTTLLLGAFAGPLTGLFGPGYARYVSTTTLMAVAGMAASANVLLGSTAVALDRVRDWVVSDIVLAVAMAVAAFPLIANYGADGAAMTTILSYGVSVGFLAIRLRGRPRRAA